MNKTEALDHRGGTPFSQLGFALIFTALCGLAYPVVTTVLSGWLFAYQAQGSLLEHRGQVVGSALVGQPFHSEGSFTGRPSAAGDGYDPMSAAGSNLAVSNPALRERAGASSSEIAAREGVLPEQIPVDLIAASGSGLDPHISPASARLQIPRVARARELGEAELLELVAAHTERNPLGLGQPGVNVLTLNLGLDMRAPTP